tara:strand:+ start:3042 stop:4202 length:1161 start_codon:yes stop_codon:yes gene_type:complete
MPKNNNLTISIFTFLLFLFIFINSNTHFSYTPPSPVRSISTKIESTGNYQGLLKLQEAFVLNAKSIKPSVVSINKVKEVIRNLSWYDIDPENSMSWIVKIKSWFSRNLRGKKFMVESVGSGIVLDSDGYILTNYHVIEGLDRILIKLSNGREYFGKTLGYDSQTDLAVIKVSVLSSLSQPKFGYSANLQVGEWVMAIGNPYGLEGTVTVGIISGKGRNDLGLTEFESFIQTDASINPGNSGGPLINLDGNIIGVNTGVALIGSGVGFAIPIETALKIANQLVTNGKVIRGWLGVGIQNLTPNLARTLKYGNTNGVLVNRIDNNTPAQQGGVKRGDIIFQFDDKPVSDSKVFQQLVANTEIGKVAIVKVFRGGKEKILKITVGKLVS